MDKDLKLRPRIKRLLSPAVMQAELLGGAAWLWVLMIGPSVKINLFTCFLTLSLACICWIQHTTTVFCIWRLLGIAYMLLLATGFFYLMDGDPEINIFALPLTITLAISSALLFVKFLDYLLSAVFVWLLTWLCWQEGVYGEIGIYVWIFCVASVCIGSVLNISYIKTLRAVLSLESKFRELAETDYLTSIPNRRAFMESFDSLIKGGESGYLIMLDIDNFKLINDRHGHEIGDRILCSMAACLRATSGSHCAGRIGGEEFGVLITGGDELTACDYILRLLETVRANFDPPYNYSCSAGMVRFSAASTMSEALSMADKSMYIAKRNGKDCAYFEGQEIVSFLFDDSKLKEKYPTETLSENTYQTDTQ
ncbi:MULTISPECIES: GGDEF domain-containing protein [Pseudomonas syringae group]|uniref:diguanylate cyclase n=1 Tax=Pseudomonas syringae group genomosp. 3 TaxID=251701 RepID=A0ABD6VDM6_9PSED|nr:MULTISPECIES: GGDEF domain-containing protein [Pseudomonas syringae group]KPW49830.1 GGDEF domain protein [Pseudomonas syringae pv. berberidis]KPY27308.1 GGDEF domain protein [Pseudomonas syringae pv. philadelphi]MCF5223134.1 diguanylate cyclase [Pseudomonas syringae]MCF5243035.1 diguanylate cyclase [Pseudomonas syringae]POD70572.1 GGDEF domain-containing protein [Pseudomonas syringae group genomosp. 3]